METLISFLVKASAGIILFYLVYWLFLRNETYHNANRWFLLAALFTSVLLPLFPVHYTLLMEQGNNTNLLVAIPDTFKHIPAVTETEHVAGSFNWQQAVLLVYFTGAAIFMFRLLTQTIILIQLMIKHRIKSLEGIRIVENEKYGLPFSFFNVVFINPKFHKQENLPEILAHEKVHIRENHWFDLLFIELLTVIFWFNPFIWFFERSIKQNHEYLADKGVLAQGHHVGRYQALLINQLMGMQIIGVTNNLNFALNTNRLKMMTKTKTSRVLGIKFLWALPAIALLLFAFAEPDYKAKNFETVDFKTTITEKLKGEKELLISGKVLMKETGESLPGASIVIKGSSVGTVADIDGSFNLVDPNPQVENDGGLKTTLVVSFVGLKTIEKTFGISVRNIKNQKDLNVVFNMEEGVIGIGPADKLMSDRLPPPPPPPAPIVGDEEVFYIVEDLPDYPGGPAALNNYIYKMQQKISRAKNVKGKAKVVFTVNPKGKVTDIKIVEKDNEGVAKGAIQIVSEMPVWTPGKQRGKPVPVKFLLPLEFN